jgi:hypothetical protein
MSPAHRSDCKLAAGCRRPLEKKSGDSIQSGIWTCGDPEDFVSIFLENSLELRRAVATLRSAWGQVGICGGEWSVGPFLRQFLDIEQPMTTIEQ